MSSPVKFDPSRLASRLQELSTAAKTLNELSDELSTQIDQIEEVLNALNLGVRADVNAQTLNESEDGLYTHWLRLAYGKHKNGWGFLVEELTEDLNNPHTDTYESWPFKKASREFRLKVVESIPALLERLLKESTDATSNVTKKVELAREIARSLSKPSPDRSGK